MDLHKLGLHFRPRDRFEVEDNDNFDLPWTVPCGQAAHGLSQASCAVGTAMTAAHSSSRANEKFTIAAMRCEI